MYHYAYLLTFVNGMQYVGARSTNLNPLLDTTYLGSGRALPKDRHTINIPRKQILKEFSTREALMVFEKDYIISNGCRRDPRWYNARSATYDRHGETPWNKGISIDRTNAGKTFSERYKGNRTPAMIASHATTAERNRGVKNPDKGHLGTTNTAFIPWYYITPEGIYKEIFDVTKRDMAKELGFTERQIGHRFHYTNEHQKAKTLPLKGWTFGNLPKPLDTAED